MLISSSSDFILKLSVDGVLAVYPGLFIAVTVLMFNLIGNTLRDVLDPRI